MTLEDMLAREAIRYTIALYNRAADNAEYELHHQVFHPDARFEIHGQSPLHGPAEIVNALRLAGERRGVHSPGCFQRHNLATSMIELNGPEAATATTYIIVVTELGIDHAGRYDDVFRRHGERWLILNRRATMEWARPDSRFSNWLGAATPVHRSI